MSVIKQILETEEEYRRCELTDIVKHFAKIKHWIPKKEHKEFKNRMLTCQQKGTAWMNENAFL